MNNNKLGRNLKRKKSRIGFIFILCLILIVPVSLAFGGYKFFREENSEIISYNKLQTSTWTSNGTIICNEEGEQKNSYSISDGDGGAIITWYDFRKGGSNKDIYAQRINSSGVIQWETNGTVICNATGNQVSPRIVRDMNGGAIITWYDERDGPDSDDIYAQRIDSSGTIQWEENGIVICEADDAQTNPMIIGDGNGGAIIVWGDKRNGTSEDDIYAQKIDSSGIIQWEGNGTLICNASNQQSNPMIMGDGNGEAIITWLDSRAGNLDIYAQKIDSSGASLWETNGIAICNVSGTQIGTDIISDGEGRTIFTWRDMRTGEQDIYAQKVDNSGIPQWVVNGTVICNAENYQNAPKLVSDGTGGGIITWKDNRAGELNIYAQRINSAGITQWEANGTAICNAIGKQEKPSLISDEQGGAIITWSDERDGSFNNDIYAQRINSTGVTQWETNGTVICNAFDEQINPKIINSGNGKAIIVWKDKRSDDGDIYAQIISYETEGTEPDGIPGFSPLLIIGMILVLSAIIIATKKCKTRKISP